MLDTMRQRWEALTFATPRPARRLATLTVLGCIGGLGEAVIVVLVVGVAAQPVHGGRGLPLISSLPSGAWARAGIALAVLVVIGISHYWSARLGARIAAEAQETVRRRLVSAYLGAGWEAHVADRTGHLQELAMTGATQIAVGTQQAATAVTLVFNLLMVLGAALVVSIPATLGLIAIAALSVLATKPLRSRSRRIAREGTELSIDLATEITETAQIAPELQVAGVARAADERIGERIGRARVSFEALRHAARTLPTLVRDITMGVVIVVVAALASRGDISLPALGAAVLLLIRALSFAQGISSITGQLHERAANVERIRGTLATWEAQHAPEGQVPCERVGAIELRSVSFMYPDASRQALSDLSLTIEPGEELGIIGATGAGKSTLALTILGLLRPTTGAVTAGGVELAEIRPGDWHERIAWVPQEPRLITGSVRDNIRFLRPRVAEQDIEAAARAAHLGEELAGWPAGLDHPVGPGGKSLSVGQRQRVALARALAGEPDLLVLDEPTSALDAHTEAAVRDALSLLRGTTTLVVIAHRLSTMRTCDRVAVLDGGRLAALGPPADLATSDPFYREALALSGMAP